MKALDIGGYSRSESKTHATREADNLRPKHWERDRPSTVRLPASSAAEEGHWTAEARDEKENATRSSDELVLVHP